MSRTDKSKLPIGVFDSGLGGLTVMKALMKILPYEDIVYFGDTARVPYGSKSPDSIIRFSQENARILLKHRVKMIVVACNSSSSYALRILQRSVSVPVVGVIDPGVRKALAVTQAKKVGVIATTATIQSRAYEKKIKKYDSSVKVFSQACPLFVPLVEEGWLTGKVTFSVASQYLKKMKAKGVDALILGCTHYPLLKATLKKVMGPRTALIDSAQETARKVQSVLSERKEAQVRKRKASYTFLSSDAPDHFRASAGRFLKNKIKNVKKCCL